MIPGFKSGVECSSKSIEILGLSPVMAFRAQKSYTISQVQGWEVLVWTRLIQFLIRQAVLDGHPGSFIALKVPYNVTSPVIHQFVECSLKYSIIAVSTSSINCCMYPVHCANYYVLSSPLNHATSKRLQNAISQCVVLFFWLSLYDFLQNKLSVHWIETPRALQK